MKETVKVCQYIGDVIAVRSIIIGEQRCDYPGSETPSKSEVVPSLIHARPVRVCRGYGAITLDPKCDCQKTKDVERQYESLFRI